MATSASVEAVWAAFRAERTAHQDRSMPNTYFDAWAFGNTPEMADRLGRLVVDGKKTATAGAIWEYEHYQWPIHDVGAHIVILDGGEQPICIIEAVEVETKPLHAVDLQFALDEGEGFTSVEGWVEGHLAYFERAFAGLELTAEPSMPMLFTRFRVVYRP